MRMRVTHPNGLRYGGKTYAKGEEFEIAERNTRYHVAALLAAKKAEKADPFIVGSPPPLPGAVRRGRPPKSLRPSASPEPSSETLEPPVAEQKAATDTQAVEPTPPEPEQVVPEAPHLAPIQPHRADEDAVVVPDGTYERRDLRAQE